MVARDEDVGWGAIATGAVLAGEVEEVLVGGDRVEEVGGPPEVLEVEELGLDGGVTALDVGVGVGAGWRVEAVLGAGGQDGAVESIRTVVDGVAVELAAEVGAYFNLGEVDAVDAQVLEYAVQREGGVGLRQIGRASCRERV